MSGTKTCENVILNDNFQKSWRERQFQNLPKIDPEQQFAEKLLGSKICTMYNLHPWDKLKDTVVDNCGQHPPHHYLGCQRKEVDIC